MDFVSDALFNGKRFRALTVVDAFTRECLTIHADQGIKGEAVATVMERLTFQRGTAPAKIRGGQRSGVYLPGARPIGLYEQGDVGLLQAREAHGQCVRRIIQRTAQR